MLRGDIENAPDLPVRGVMNTRYHPDSAAGHPVGPRRPPTRPRPVTRPRVPPYCTRVQGGGSGISIHLGPPRRFAPATGSLSGEARVFFPSSLLIIPYFRGFLSGCQGKNHARPRPSHKMIRSATAPLRNSLRRFWSPFLRSDYRPCGPCCLDVFNLLLQFTTYFCRSVIVITAS